jgi:negative regulator of sigma E activity
MTAFAPEDWQRVPPGELDRLESRLRRRRWLRNVTTAAIVVVVLAAAAFGTVQGVAALARQTAPAAPPTGTPCHSGDRGDTCTPK